MFPAYGAPDSTSQGLSALLFTSGYPVACSADRGVGLVTRNTLSWSLHVLPLDLAPWQCVVRARSDWPVHEQLRPCKYKGTKVDVSSPCVLSAEQKLPCLWWSASQLGMAAAGSACSALNCVGLTVGLLRARPTCCFNTSSRLPDLSAK